MLAPVDAEQRLREAGRALRSIAAMKQPLHRKEIFYGCPFADGWQRELLTKLEAAGLVERVGAANLRDLKWVAKVGSPIEEYIEEPERLSRLLWPEAFGFTEANQEQEESEEVKEPEKAPTEEVPPTEVPTELEVLHNLVLLTVQIKDICAQRHGELDELQATVQTVAAAVERIQKALEEVLKPSIEMILEGVAAMEKRMMKLERRLEE
jgi:hypothetical protein